jgi:ankyrin repeat protein
MAIIGDHDAIELLILAGANIDARDNLGSTPLYHAVYNVQKTAVSALIKSGADPDLRSNSGVSPRRLIEGNENLAWMSQLLVRNE